MSDRETLAKLIRETMEPGMSWRYMVHEDRDIADAILNRWRLVPVEEASEDLTDRELKMMKWGRDQGYRQALDAAAMLAEVGGAAAIRELIKRRTDNHGPHED